MNNTEPLAKNFIPIILGSDVNAYGIARSFYEAYGIKSLVVCQELWVVCQNTKFISKAIIDLKLETDEAFVKTLKSLAASLSKSESDLILIPCGDAYSELISRNQKLIENEFRFITVDYKLHQQLNRKETFYELCDKYGLAHPPTWIINKENYKEQIPDLVFPLVIKPSNSIMYWDTTFPGKRKAFMARDEQEYTKILNAIYHSTYTDAFILQEFIPGNREGEFHFYSDQNGIVKFMQFDEMILGSPTPDGIGSHTAETPIDEPELSEQFRIFLDAIGYRGYGNIDFKYDPRDKKWKVFEINLRPARCSYAMTAAGHNLAEFIVNDLIHNKPLEFTIATESVLYTLVSDILLKKYAQTEWLPTIDKLLQSKRVVRHYLPKEDMNVMRLIDHLRDQIRYFYKYRKYFGKSMITDL
jgi:D-aspartate ligase